MAQDITSPGNYRTEEGGHAFPFGVLVMTMIGLAFVVALGGLTIVGLAKARRFRRSTFDLT